MPDLAVFLPPDLREALRVVAWRTRLGHRSPDGEPYPTYIYDTPPDPRIAVSADDAARLVGLGYARRLPRRNALIATAAGSQAWRHIEDMGS